MNYAEMQNGKRIFSVNSDAKTLALSSKIDANQEMRILVGRYYSIDNGTFLPSDIEKEISNVTITINNYPYLVNATVPFTIQKIPKGNLFYQNSPLDAPITTFSGFATLIGSTITITLPNFLDGDVYCLYLNSTSILGNNKVKPESSFTIFPNPVSNIITITTTEYIIEKIVFLNSLGQVIKENSISEKYFTLNISDLPEGIYYIKIGNSIKKFIKN